MRKFVASILGVGLLALSIYAAYYDTDAENIAYLYATDVYDISIVLRVPQVVDNSQSLGRRVYQKQRINGTLNVNWMDDGSYAFELVGLYNKDFMVGGKNVTYVGVVNSDVLYPRFTWIGNNQTEKFKTPTLTMFVELEPSYALSAPNDDNAFRLLLSGRGTSVMKRVVNGRIALNINGYVTGTQGCGCMDYGHKSPTREANMSGPSKEEISDVVATFGKWKAKWKKRLIPYN